MSFALSHEGKTQEAEHPNTGVVVVSTYPMKTGLGTNHRRNDGRKETEPQALSECFDGCGGGIHDGCLLGCCALSDAADVLTRAKVTPGGFVAVFGCGCLGRVETNAAQLCGARQIIAIDFVPHKLDWAREFGATDTIDASQAEPAEAVSAATGSTMADFAFNFSGLAAAINQTVGIVHNGGVVVLEGAGFPGTQLVVDQAELLDNEKVITGAHAGGGIRARDLR